MQNAERVWGTCLGVLRHQVPEATWISCFQPTTALSLDDGILVVAVPSSLARDRIESWRSHVDKALACSDGGPFRVRFEVRPGEAGGDGHRPSGPSGPSFRELGPEAGDPSSAAGALNPAYTFETFVTGDSNRLSSAAAQRVAETPGRPYNPLYLYGASGLGKTHLLHAIGNYVNEHYSSYVVRYVSCEGFVSDYVDAIRTNNMGPFKRRYREAHVLLLDDMQFMLDKERSNEEFFHIFNVLHGMGRQIVISSDRPAREMELPERMRSRLEWGLPTDIRPPGPETRLAIAHKKAEALAVPVTDDVLAFIADRITTNIRELEGALTRVAAHASIHSVTPTVESTKEILDDLFGDARELIVTARKVKEVTAEKYGFTVEELCGRSRRRPLVTARQIAMYVCRDQTDLSFPAIGREFGGRDHTTVIHAVDKITALMAERPAIYEQVEDLIKSVQNRRDR